VYHHANSSIYDARCQRSRCVCEFNDLRVKSRICSSGDIKAAAEKMHATSAVTVPDTHLSYAGCSA